MSVKTRLPKVRQASKSVVLCLNKSPFESIYGLRSLSSPEVNYQIRLKWNNSAKLEDIPYSQVSCWTFHVVRYRLLRADVCCVKG
jgi:hypothetical protein